MVVCFIGDSLTQGIGDQLALGWVGRLAQASFAKNPEHARSLTLCNLGLRSDTSLRIAKRWRQETDRRRRPGEDMAFVFCFGAADHKFHMPMQESLDVSRRLLAEAASLGDTLFIAPPPALEPGWNEHIRLLGREICGVCAGLGVPTFDFHAPLLSQAEYMAALQLDGIHPDAAGYGRMAGLLHGFGPLARLLGL